MKDKEADIKRIMEANANRPSYEVYERTLEQKKAAQK
jgi:hypothetical protein